EPFQLGADLGAGAGLPDGGEDEGAAVADDVGGGDDGRAVDRLADLAGVEVDEGANARALLEQFAGERLADGAGAPDDDAVACGEERAAEEVDLAAAEGGGRVAGVRPRSTPLALAPLQQALGDVRHAVAGAPEPQHEVVVLGP